MSYQKFLAPIIGMMVAILFIAACNIPMHTPSPPSKSTPSPEGLNLWQDVTMDTIGLTEDWTNKVELADITGDGLVDILFANGSEYNSPGDPEISRVFVNRGAGEMFEDVSEAVFGSEGMLARVIKVRDVNSDGHADILVGTTYETQSRLFIGDASGNFTDVTETQLPQIDASVGDLEFGDVDADGDLDVVLADWGLGDPWRYESDSDYRYEEGNDSDYYPCPDYPWGQLSYDGTGGRTMLWLNDGAGNFTDVTADQMPESLVSWSWDLEFVDIDNDYDLDILVSCKMCDDGGFIFENDGTGLFTDISAGNMPQFLNNYEYEAIDLDGDDYLDLITANDDPQEGCEDDLYFTEHVFLNTTEGGFVNATDDLWPLDQQIGIDDNQGLYLDYDSDGDADVLMGALILPLPGYFIDYDRIMENDGSGHLTMKLDLFGGKPTSGTLGIAVADLNGDHKLDVVQGQGEFASDNRVFFGTNIAPDTAAPIITLVERVDDVDAGQTSIQARIHDNKSPTMPHDWREVVLLWYEGEDEKESSMEWYGEYLWRTTVPSASEYFLCAIDAAGNETCCEIDAAGNEVCEAIETETEASQPTDEASTLGLVEAITFRLASEVSVEDFLKADQAIEDDYVAQQPGYLSRETVVSEDNQWFVGIRWDSKTDSDAAVAGLGEAPSAEAFLAALDHDTLLIKQYELHRSTGQNSFPEAGVIEVITYRLQEGADINGFLTADQALEDTYIAQQPGFIARETGLSEDGEWIIIIHWESAADSEASLAGLGETSSAEAFISFIDEETLLITVYEVK